MSFDDDESLEQTLLVVREVSVYKIPPRGTTGYKCAEWLQSDKIWGGRLRVLALKDKCEIRLEDSNTGELFAGCQVLPGKREACVESVTDSSRYFVLRIEDGRGKHAYIGLGFAERNEAFDFNVALSDHEKYVKRELEKEQAGVETDAPQQQSLDLRLKEGQTIRINVKTKASAGTGMLSSATATGGANAVASTGRMKAPLAPPPGGGRIRAPLPPPPNDTKAVRSGANTFVQSSICSGNSGPSGGKLESGRPAGDPFADLAQLELALPSTAKQGPTTTGGDPGWAAF